VLEAEAVAVECGVKPRRSVDEKHGVVESVFRTQFREKLFGQRHSSGWKQSHVEEFVGIGIDGGVQPEALIVELDHGFVDRDVIQLLPIDWL
jgi:hypothetical protein